jgi:hypothetical protein
MNTHCHSTSLLSELELASDRLLGFELRLRRLKSFSEEALQMSGSPESIFLNFVSARTNKRQHQ